MTNKQAFKKGTKVKVLPYSRTKTIFQNADCTPGETKHYKGGWEGTVVDICSDGYDGLIVGVAKNGDENNYYEFSDSELEIIEPA